jgi:hypothetical protein
MDAHWDVISAAVLVVRMAAIVDAKTAACLVESLLVCWVEWSVAVSVDAMVAWLVEKTTDR